MPGGECLWGVGTEASDRCRSKASARVFASSSLGALSRRVPYYHEASPRRRGPHVQCGRWTCTPSISACVVEECALQQIFILRVLWKETWPLLMRVLTTKLPRQTESRYRGREAGGK